MVWFAIDLGLPWGYHDEFRKAPFGMFTTSPGWFITFPAAQVDSCRSKSCATSSAKWSVVRPAQWFRPRCGRRLRQIKLILRCHQTWTWKITHLQVNFPLKPPLRIAMFDCWFCLGLFWVYFLSQSVSEDSHLIAVACLYGCASDFSSLPQGTGEFLAHFVTPAIVLSKKDAGGTVCWALLGAGCWSSVFQKGLENHQSLVLLDWWLYGYGILTIPFNTPVDWYLYGL